MGRTLHHPNEKTQTFNCLTLDLINFKNKKKTTKTKQNKKKNKQKQNRKP
jgi:hypothetical protein